MTNDAVFNKPAALGGLEVRIYAPPLPTTAQLSHKKSPIFHTMTM